MASLLSQVDFWYAYWGSMAITNALIFVLSIITALAVGFNRLSSIPLIISAVGAISSGFAWLAWKDFALGKGLLYFARFTAQFGWHVQEVVAIFYSYFLLKRIQKNNMDTGFFGRRSFTSLY